MSNTDEGGTSFDSIMTFPWEASGGGIIENDSDKVEAIRTKVEIINAKIEVGMTKAEVEALENFLGSGIRNTRL